MKLIKISLKHLVWWWWVLSKSDYISVIRKIKKELDETYDSVYSSNYLIRRLGTIEKGTVIGQNILLGVVAALVVTFLSGNLMVIYKTVNPIRKQLTLPNIIKIFNIEDRIRTLDIAWSLFELMMIILIFLIVIITVICLIMRIIQLVFSSPYYTFILPYERKIIIEKLEKEYDLSYKGQSKVQEQETQTNKTYQSNAFTDITYKTNMIKRSKHHRRRR